LRRSPKRIKREVLFYLSFSSSKQSKSSLLSSNSHSLKSKYLDKKTFNKIIIKQITLKTNNKGKQKATICIKNFNNAIAPFHQAKKETIISFIF
jgi:hypothetical protein